VLTTLSTPPDYVMGPPIQQELAGRDLLPGQQWFDAGYVDAELLVTAQSQHQIEVVGPLSANSGWQSRAATGYGLEAFELDWEAEKARCPQGSHSGRWTPGRDVSGDPVVRIRFHGPTCRACEVRSPDWLRKGKVDPLKRRPGHFARLAPHPKFGLAASLSSATAS
jgi:transposase